MFLDSTGIVIAIYFAVVIAIGFWVRRQETTGDFLIGDRKVGLWQTSASIFAVVGGLLTVGQAALAYEIGFAAMWFWVGIALGVFFLGMAAKQIKSLSDKHKFLTLADYIFTKYDFKSGTLAALIVFVGFFALLTGQFIAGGNLFAPLLGISYPAAVLILGAGTLAYLLLGGFKAVVKTDFLQAVIMLFVFALLLLFINIGDFTPEQSDLTALGGYGTLSLIALGGVVIFGSGDIWQRLIAASSVRTAQRASYYATPLFILFGIVVTIAGIAARNNFPSIGSEEALFYGLFQLLPPQLVAVAVVVLLAAIMSTIDTELFMLSSSVAKDFFYRRKKIDEEEMARIVRKSLIVLALVSMAIAVFVSQILTVMFGLLSLILAVAPSVIGSLFWRLKSNAVFLSMVVGVLALVYLALTNNFNPETSAITLPAAVIGLVIGQLVLRGDKGVPNA